MSGRPILVDQLIADQKLNKQAAQQVAMLSSMADAGRSLMAAARACGLEFSTARSMADRFGIQFKSGGPA